jgi:hypothetical protein
MHNIHNLKLRQENSEERERERETNRRETNDYEEYAFE